MASRNSFLHSLPLLSLYYLLLSPAAALSSGTQEDPSPIISRFQQYLQINTAQPNPDYEASTKFLLSQAESISLQAQSIEFVAGKPVVVIHWPGSDPTLPSVLLYSHTDVVPSEPEKWDHHPFSAHLDENGNIYARGSQDMKCVGMQYLEAVRKLKASGFQPKRSVYLVFAADEEIGGHDGAEKLAESENFKKMNVGVVLDEGTFFYGPCLAGSMEAIQRSLIRQECGGRIGVYRW